MRCGEVMGVQSCFFFFQAEDGIRDLYVTGVQTCALPIWTVAATIVPTLLKEVFGYAPAAPAGTTISAGWSVTGGNVGASGTFPAGWVGFFGARRDGRADGQPGLIGTHIANAMTLLNALPGIPNNT